MGKPSARPSQSLPARMLAWAALPLIGLVRAYQLVLSPWIGHGCRFQPTCSHYALDVLRAHGAARGTWLTLRRILRCHPWGGSGYDPAPGPAHHPHSHPQA